MLFVIGPVTASVTKTECAVTMQCRSDHWVCITSYCSWDSISVVRQCHCTLDCAVIPGTAALRPILKFRTKLLEFSMFAYVLIPEFRGIEHLCGHKYVKLDVIQNTAYTHPNSIASDIRSGLLGPCFVLSESDVLFLRVASVLCWEAVSSECPVIQQDTSFPDSSSRLVVL